MSSLLVSMVAFLGLAGCATPPQPAVSPFDLAQDKRFDTPGGRLFLQHCTPCHGERSRGDLGPPLDATGHASDHSDSELIRGITQGVRRPGASAEMPAWGGQLSPREIRQLVEFIKSLWTEEQRQLQSILTASQ